MLNRGAIADVFPGLALSIGIAGISQALEVAEVRLFGTAWVDGLVLAIVLGTLLHTLWGLPARYAAGVQFAAKTVLEIAIVLLGASISAASLAASGIATIGAVVAVVVASLGLSYGVGRLLGLDDRLATLVSCGNSICGNSAILATAPVIEAEAGETVLDAALRNGIDIEHACEKSCACTTCHVVIREGFNSLEASDELEDDMLDKAWGLEPTSRLSCQAVVADEDLVVEIPKYTINQVSEGH